MKLQLDPRLPDSAKSNWPAQITSRLYEIFREIAIAFNRGYFWDTEGTAAPTAGTYAQGDTCRNTAPAEAGTASSKYVVMGWVCTVSGTPGTWLPIRTLTGN